jgi:3'(2'), 5'-bisphosphate nucleotidase
MLYERERKVAIDVVLEACQLCENVQKALVTDDTVAKSDKSPVTVADFGSQAIIAMQLLKYFSQDSLVGEEEADVLRQDDQSTLRESVISHVQAIKPELDEAAILDAIDYGAKSCDFSQRYWTLDPVDGTKGFLRKDQYAVALALIEDGSPVLGVLGCPNLPFDLQHPEQGRGCLFVAVKGQGAWMRPLTSDQEQRISVDTIEDPAQAHFCESLESGHSSQDAHANIATNLGVTAQPYRMDSQCKYGIVARGEASIYLRLMSYKSWIWDQAAGAIIVEEAGGMVTDMHGKTLDFSQGRRLFQNSGVVATNGILHKAVLAVGQNGA